MKDTLHDLKIELDEKDCINNQTPADDAVDINASEEDLGASDVGPELVDEMQNLIKANKELEEQIISLQEKLSVSYTKESEYEDEIEKQKAQIKVLSESKKNSDALKKRLDKLLEDNNIKYEHIDIDTPNGEGLSIKFNVTSIPTLVITDDEENILRKRIGVPTLDELMKFIYETD